MERRKYIFLKNDMTRRKDNTIIRKNSSDSSFYGIVKYCFSIQEMKNIFNNVLFVQFKSFSMHIMKISFNSCTWKDYLKMGNTIS